MTSIVFTPDGTARCLYTEAIDLSQIGALKVERASRVEFDNHLQAWRVSVEGVVLFAAFTRQECLDWEQRYFETKEDQRHGNH